jgi:putative transposase
MSRFRLYPDAKQEQLLLAHCAHARYVWNLAVEQHNHWRPGRKSAPGYLEQARQLTAARADNAWLASGSVIVQQQALRDFWHAKQRFFQSGFGHPDWRKKHFDEGFRITDTCKVERLNRKWAWVKVPKVGWVRFRLTRPDLPVAKSYRVTFINGQWHVAFAVIPVPVPAPGNGQVIGIDRGVTITAALSDSRLVSCPQLTSRERARVRKHQRRAARAPKGSDRKAAEHARVAWLKAREAARRKDWCEKISTELARSYDVIRFEKLNIINMTASAKGTTDNPGKNIAQKAGLNGAILAQGWGLLRRRTGDKAPGRVQDVPAPFTSLRCSRCGWIDKNSRKSQADFCCSSCGFTCNADINAAINVAAGHAGGTTPRKRSSVREPHLATP